MTTTKKKGTSVFRRERGAATEGPYHGRELSWLAFNRRVLEEALEADQPLLEKAKFLAIVSSNLDEFAMVRVAELHQWARGESGDRDLSPAEARAEAERHRAVLERVRAAMRRLVDDQYRCWRTQVEPALAREGLDIVPPTAWTATDRETLRTHYLHRIEPVLTPLAVDPARPFPRIPNRVIAVALQLEPAAGGERRNALVAVPTGSRLIALVEGSGRHALVEDAVMAFLDGLFPGFRIVGRCLFRLTRDGSLDIDEDQAADLLIEIEQELRSRESGVAVRLEVAAAGDAELRAWLVERLRVDAAGVVPVDGPLDLTFLFAAGDRVDAAGRGARADLRDPPLPVLLHPAEWSDPFAAIRAGDILLHHPYEGFQRVVDLVERAADDPAVLAIKQTLYRTSGDSPIVRALTRAARAGKQVTVLVELKARFDEANNIRWARVLEDAGAHVVYGLLGYKVHAKLLMVVRREPEGLARYCHLGTGNYNDKTARLYTDLSYLTANEAVCRDVAALFNMLTGHSQPPRWERLAVSPLTMRERFTAWIRREAGLGRKGLIRAKFNALVDESICDELYAAAKAGARVELCVRGMCILRAVHGIRVVSVVHRLLEHSRIYHFGNHGGEPVWAIASADWMTRNLDRRVESLVQIEPPRLVRRLDAILSAALADTVHARELLADGTYRQVVPARGATPRDHQREMIAEAAAQAATPKPNDDARRFKPRRKGG